MIWKKQNGTEILEVLGEGLTSRVYKAIRKHSTLNVQQVVALKVLHSQELIHSLKNEIELLLSVDSPYCVKMLGWEETAKGLALVLEFLDGVSLEELCRYRSLNHLEIDEIIFQVQEGLKELHRNGIVHGDLSLKNVFVTNTGNIKIIDFGFSSRENKTCDYGTPNCMAIEVWRGEKLSMQSDLFSLGLLRESLWEKSESQAGYRNWRARAEGALNKNSLLLEKSEDRHFMKLYSSSECRTQIATYVQDMQRWRSQHQATLKIGKSTIEQAHKYLPLKRALSIIVAVFASVSVSAVEPVHFREKGSIYHNLDVRSRVWVNTRLFKKTNGKEMLYQEGYVPVSYNSLPRGEYVLHWTSQEKSGMMDIHMHGDQRIIIDAQ